MSQKNPSHIPDFISNTLEMIDIFTTKHPIVTFAIMILATALLLWLVAIIHAS